MKKFKKNLEDELDAALMAAAFVYLWDDTLKRYSLRGSYGTLSTMEMLRIFVDKFIYKKPCTEILSYYHPSTVRKYSKLMEEKASRMSGISFVMNCNTNTIGLLFLLKRKKLKKN